MNVNIEQYLEHLEKRKQTIMEGLCTKGRTEVETEYDRGRIAELKQQISYLTQLAKQTI